MATVFLSHSSRDKSFARRLASLLKGRGISIWIDESELKIGDSLLKKISEAIHKTDYVVAVISKNSVKSNWVQKELAIAMNYEISDNKVKVLPLIIDNCEMPAYLVDKLYLDFRNMDDFGEPLNKLLHSIGIENIDLNKPQFSNIQFCSESMYDKDSNECTINQTIFTKPINLIYVSWNYNNVFRGMKFCRKWYKDGILWRAKEDIWDEIWDDNKPASTFILNKNGHPEGKYTIRLFIENEYICSANFTIE